ncbi:tRNA epoxyqueuosine(34) reductase QueG [Leptospira perolatii]|uniref:tRNA epoxyqueuosine(34) reductase QueG n=1 Tax=Leptospira perolatii TaxID=2023191 RepID=A0A2M9ZMN4_9LEPT|nr:tRNA epoxyqueuosine(34) reductase QueG [Leptospira perolatii]PJZ70137.1 tRNA epoxyqueuosine(34) reductase QueG [Leptospira perolatii]PJZ73326.1 tRNA epoxyqueuosine(34) reductase QueG [Leptospira perolatii]
MVLESKELLPDLEKIAFQNGFQLVGAAKALVPNSDKKNILQWVQEGRFGTMNWYPKNMNLRLELEGLGFSPESVLVLGAVYYDEDSEAKLDRSKFRFSRYAMGEDYHSVLRKRTKSLLEVLRTRFPENQFRHGVDSLPVPEKVLAREAGIGWIGKNTNLIHEDFGSFFFLSTIFTDLPLRIESTVAKDRCGTCDLCIRACPTSALEPYRIDARKCISYRNIEDKSEEATSLHGWLYGCDICQEVCPWNRVKAKSRKVRTAIPEFKPKAHFIEEPEKLLRLTEDEFTSFFSDSAVLRIGFKKYRRNIENL